MSREILSFIIFIAALALSLFLGGEDWRAHQQTYRQAALTRTRQNWQEASSQRQKAVPADSLLEMLEKKDLSSRLETLADSLTAVRSDLGAIEQTLLAARDLLNGFEPVWDEDDANEYFAAVRSFRRTGRIAADLEDELTAMSQGLDALERLASKGDRTRQPKVNWLCPPRVPVREACTTCHLPLGNGNGVMLYPDSSRIRDYPAVMKAHDYRQFGCTVCHAGVAGSIDFRQAHGPDSKLRPFRPSRLAYRGCGRCHADRSPLATDMVIFSWPESCIECHQGESLSALADSAGNTVLDIPLDEGELRSWLLRHWAEKSGVVPSREAFDKAVAMLISGDVRGKKPEAEGESRDSLSWGKTTAASYATCPSCGRTYGLSVEGQEVFCPVDGARLVAGQGKQ